MLGYNPGDTPADKVFGQGGSFFSRLSGAPAPGSLNLPAGVAVDSGNSLYIADFANSRVLQFDDPFGAGISTADRVFGQPNLTSGSYNQGLISPNANTLANPSAMVVDGSGNLVIADTSNNRAPGYDRPLAPTISSLSPNTATANPGASPFSVTVRGTNFLQGSQVKWNGANRATTWLGSTTELQATILGSDIATAGTASVTVVNPSSASGTSNVASFAITNPAPSLTSLAPISALVNGSGFTLTVTGENFVGGAKLRWNGADLATNFDSTTQLSATIDASRLTTAGFYTIKAVNPAPGGGESESSLIFTVFNPSTQSISSLNPPAKTAGNPGFTLTVNGTGFVSNSVVYWNGTPRSTKLYQIANPTPAITTLNPAGATAGGSGFTLTVAGSGFVSGSGVSTLYWNGTAKTTTVDTSTQITVAISAADVATAGTVGVQVKNGGPGGGDSNTASFAITNPPPPNPAPAISGLSPNSAPAGSGDLTLTITGSSFVAGALVNWTTASQAASVATLTPTGGTATSISVVIPAGQLATAGTATVAVVNPAPGGGPSNTLSFTITGGARAPTISSLSPARVAVNSPSFTLTVNSSNFADGTVVRWAATDLTTVFVSRTQLTATVPADKLTQEGSFDVTVVNPAVVGGGAASPVPFGVGKAYASLSIVFR